MKLTINGEPQTSDCDTLGLLIVHLGHSPDAVATAVNGEFVAKSARDEQQLRPDDAIEIIAPMAGG